jgi:hypothetical protein
MNDNTIIRIKVPARLYESVKAKLMIKENYEAPVEETEIPVKEDNRRGMDADTIEAVNRALKMIMQEINVEKDPQQRELLKKVTVDLGQILQWLKTKWARKGAEAMNEAPVEETETLEESPVVDVIAALSGVLGLGLTSVAVAKAQDLLKKKNPELYNKLASVHGAVDKAKGLNEAKKVDPKKAAEEKKKKEAEAKKVADKKAADKKKAAEKKK